MRSAAGRRGNAAARRQDGATAGGVLVQAGGKVEADRLPAQRLALLPQRDQALDGVEVHQAQSEGAATATRGLGVQSQQQRVRDDAVAAGPRDLVDLGELPWGQGPARARQPAGLLDLMGGAGTGRDAAVGDGAGKADGITYGRGSELDE